MHNQGVVSFHGQNLELIEQNGEAYIAMRPVVEGLGLDWSAQRRKLKKYRVRFGRVVIKFPSKGGIQNTACIPLKKLNGWLLLINTNKVRADIKAKLETYQEECSQVLYEYWFKGVSKKSSANDNPEQRQTKNIELEMDLRACDTVAQMLDLSDGARLIMESKVYANHGKPISYQLALARPKK